LRFFQVVQGARAEAESQRLRRLTQGVASGDGDRQLCVNSRFWDAVIRTEVAAQRRYGFRNQSTTAPARPHRITSPGITQSRRVIQGLTRIAGTAGMKTLALGNPIITTSALLSSATPTLPLNPEVGIAVIC
jgi:hypothetical protein